MIRAMEKQMSATVSDSREEEFAASAGWINRFLHLKKTNINQKDVREFTEKLEKFVTFSSQISDRKELNAWSVQ